MSMAIVSSQTLSFDSISNHREASFSSYLHGDEGILALNLSESNQNITSIHSNSHDLIIYASPEKIEDKEIGVFSAEKYFKGDMDDDGDPKSTDTSSKSYQHEKDIPVNIDPVKPKVQPRTPSIRSSSSYSSQTVLLPTNHQSRNMKKAFCKSFLSSLSCKCSCKEKNPVVINDHVVESNKQSKIPDEQTNKAAEPDQKNKAPARRWSEQEKVPYKKLDEIKFRSRRKESFNFPVLNPKKGSLAATVESPGEDNARKSLEVFGSPRTPITNQVNKTLSFGRKATVFTWDLVNPQMDETGIPKNQDVTSDDYESDASSELFEIESFSTKTNSILGRQTTDGASGCLTPTTCYAPSEASIQWSVITASAADFSIMSDSEDLRTANTKNQNRMTRFAKNGPEKELHKRLPNILSGCKSQKAVRVAGDAYKASDKVIPISQGRHRLDPSKPVAKFQAETKLTGFNSRLGSNAFNTSVVSPGNGSHLLYIK